MKKPINCLKPEDARATSLQLFPYSSGQSIPVEYARTEVVEKRAEFLPSEAGSIDVLLSVRIRFSPPS